MPNPPPDLNTISEKDINPSFEYVSSLKFSHTSALSSFSTSTIFTTSPFQADQKHIAAEIEKEWETVSEVFPELSTNPGEPATNPPFSPSTTQAIISSPLKSASSLTSAPPPSTLNPTPQATFTTPTPPPPPITPKKSKKSIKTQKSTSNHNSKETRTYKHVSCHRLHTETSQKVPLPFQHHKAILQLDHNTSPKSSSTTTTTTTTTKPPLLNSETTPTQSTSTNTPSTITVAITTANTATTTYTVSTIYTNTTINTTTTTNTSTQTHVPTPAHPAQAPHTHYLHNHTPVVLHLTLPHLPRTLQDLQRLGLWGAPLPSARQQPKEAIITWRF